MFTILSTSNFTALSFGGNRGFAPYGTGAIFEALSTSGVVFAYLGSRQALDYAGEARNPQRHVPLATIASVGIAMAIYIGLPEKSPPLPFPWGTLVAVGIGLVASGWGVLSGFNTQEFQAIVRAEEARKPPPARPVPPGGSPAA